MKFKSVANGICSLIFQYDTIKIVSLKSIKVGLIFRLIQLAIIGYVIGYVIVYKKGYQKTDIGISGLSSKVKGVSLTNRSELDVWDVADYVIPPQEANAFFILTNALITRKQSQGKCPEDESVNGAKCKTDSDCTAFEPILTGDGVKTGKCINNHTCEIYAWCPVENPKSDTDYTKNPLLKNVFNFTVFVKNNIEFPEFKQSTSNIPIPFNASLIYDRSTNPDFPIFKIGTILDEAQIDYNAIAIKGGVVAFIIKWDCNLDFAIDSCFPTYSFNRLDKENSSISMGWNFRYANYYYENNTQYRDLIKAYGIRFLISVQSKAGKFNFIPLTMNLGSGVALLGISTLICDFIVLYCLKSRHKYVDAKYHRVSAEDAFKVSTDLSTNSSSS